MLADLDIRLHGGEFFPLRCIEDHAMLASLFVLLALTAGALPRRVVRSARRQMAEE